MRDGHRLGERDRAARARVTLEIGELRGVRIAGAAIAQPASIETQRRGIELDNRGVYRALLGERYEEELARRGWSADFPARRWGIERRQWVCVPGAATREQRLDIVDLAREAAEAAMRDSRWTSSSIELIVAATSTPMRISSSFASQIARACGISCACIDLRAGGAGGLQALVIAAQLVAGGAARALVIGAETCSPFLDPTDFSTALLFGDGAAALALERDPSSSSGLLCASLGGALVGGEPLTIPGPLPPNEDDVRRGAYMFRPPDSEFQRAVLDVWIATARELRAHLEHRRERVDSLAPYAVHREQVEAIARELGLSPQIALEGLRERGALGASGALAAIVDLARARRSTNTSAFASLAVGGGVNTVALAWKW